MIRTDYTTDRIVIEWMGNEENLRKLPVLELSETEFNFFVQFSNNMHMTKEDRDNGIVYAGINNSWYCVKRKGGE